MTLCFSYPVTLEPVILKKATKLANSRPFKPQDCDDIAQELRLFAHQQAKFFHPDRGNWSQYMHCILDRRCESLRRCRSRRKCHPDAESFSLDEIAFDSDGHAENRHAQIAQSREWLPSLDSLVHVENLDNLPTDIHVLVYNELRQGMTLYGIHKKHKLSRRKVEGCVRYICELIGVNFKLVARNTRKKRRSSPVSH